MVWSKSSQKINMIFLIPHASWEGRVILTLFVAAFCSFHNDFDIDDLLLLLLDDVLVFLIDAPFFLFAIDAPSAAGEAGSLTPSDISLTIGDTSTWPPIIYNRVMHYCLETHHYRTRQIIILMAHALQILNTLRRNLREEMHQLGTVSSLSSFTPSSSGALGLVREPPQPLLALSDANIIDAVGRNFHCNGTSP